MLYPQRWYFLFIIKELEKIVQILIDHDFYIDGTLEDNIALKNHNFDPKEVLELANYLQFKR